MTFYNEIDIYNCNASYATKQLKKSTFLQTGNNYTSLYFSEVRFTNFSLNISRFAGPIFTKFLGLELGTQKARIISGGD